MMKIRYGNDRTYVLIYIPYLSQPIQIKYLQSIIRHGEKVGIKQKDIIAQLLVHSPKDLSRRETGMVEIPSYIQHAGFAEVNIRILSQLIDLVVTICSL